ncbi:hypothetical protein B484DRAFT_455576 [Ochromonadaceae sp. CCMP2298]|nr:hypothetical protein B484DRAFT_455576 [Ochromonadaceae sp. CCMP2298]
MCNAELVSLAARVLGKRGDAAPIFLIQSNVEDVAVTMRNIVQCSLNTCAGEARFVTPRRGQMAALMGGIFQQPFQPDGVGEGGPTWDWVALEELGGVGRTSQRLQMWLDDLAESAESAESAERAESAGGRDVDASCESVSLPRLHPFAARSRACGEGWLPLSPLPHARTETEVHCAFDKKPVHRVAFTLDGLTE